MRKKTIIKFVLLIVIPIVLGIFLFFPNEIKLEIIEEDLESNSSIIIVPDFAELNEKSGAGRMIRTILATPFNLKYYVIEIKDISDYEGALGGLGYYLYLDGKKLKRLDANSRTAETLRLTDEARNITLDTEVSVVQGDAKPGERVTFTIDFEAHARPSYGDVFAKIILVFLAWNGILFLLKEILEFTVGRRFINAFFEFKG